MRSTITPLLVLTLWLPLTGHGATKNFDNRFALGVTTIDYNFDLTFKPVDPTKLRSVEYQPNTAPLSGFQASWKGLTLAYLTSEGFEETDVALKDKASYEDLRGALFFGREKQWVFIGYYNRFKRFYIENTQAVSPPTTPPTLEFVRRPDMETFNTGATLMYIFSPEEFSASAAYTQADQQTSSGGSFLALASFDINLIKAQSSLLVFDDKSLVPDTVSDEFGDDKNFHNGKFATTSLSLGYAYTFIWKSFFLNFTALFGNGIQKREYRTDQIVNDSDRTNKSSYGYSLGYNGDNFFVGFSYVQDDLTFSTRTIEISPQQSANRFFLGYRF